MTFRLLGGFLLMQQNRASCRIKRMLFIFNRLRNKCQFYEHGIQFVKRISYTDVFHQFNSLWLCSRSSKVYENEHQRTQQSFWPMNSGWAIFMQNSWTIKSKNLLLIVCQFLSCAYECELNSMGFFIEAEKKKLNPTEHKAIPTHIHVCNVQKRYEQKYAIRANIGWIENERMCRCRAQFQWKKGE